MDYNTFEINAFTDNNIDSKPIQSGNVRLDSYYEKPWADVLAHIILHDDTFNRDVKQGDMKYTNGYPAETTSYKDIEKSKYYWDTLHQELYYYYVNEEDNPWYTPSGTFRAVNGLPPMVVNTHIEFDPNAFYFDETTDEADVYAWNSKDKWYIVQKIHNIDGEPADLFNLDNVDMTAYYNVRGKNEIYAFDYGVYFKKVDYTGEVYERMFEFYQKLQENYIDVSNTNRFTHRNYIYVSKHPSKKVTSPDEGKVYFDTTKNRMYVWKDNNWVEITQENAIIPHKIFY